MAFIYGKSNNATVAEKRRLSHGFFLIPFPEGSSREERPFGIRLCGHHQIDYERVQIRIAAVQHGFKVLVDNEGQLIPPAVFSEKVKEIQEISEELEYIYEQQVLRRKFTPEDVPVGYIPGLGHNPATLPKQSSRQRKAAKNAWSVIRSFNVRSSRQNGGTGLRRGRRNTALPRPGKHCLYSCD